MNVEYSNGMHDMMDYIKKILTSKHEGGNKEDIFDIFEERCVEDVLNNFTPIEIKEKIDEWNEERINRIDIGDVISVGVAGDLTLVVTHIDVVKNKYEGISSNGKIYTYPRDSDYIYKSKNHIDIWEILDKIKAN